ncbi:unnamed protein product [Paramecium pentaurelia]|uniref:WD40-repeat-containing domain n=1 Tax=Paramecium pentaurelia TaxID=43138 RepID=A0A8S1T4C7_9CILI|nr:unnamed protein product [Paramecium pentaurelia]
MQYHLNQISAMSYIQKLGIIVVAGDNIKLINLQKEKVQQEIKTEKFLRIFQLVYNEQDNNLYQFNQNKTIFRYRLKGRMFILDKQFKLQYEFYPTLATVTHDNQTIIIAGMDTNLIVFYNMINDCQFMIELPNPELQNYCLLYNNKNRCILTQSCLINVENKKVIRSINTIYQKIKGWSRCGHFYSKQDKQKIFITSSFKQKILRIISDDNFIPYQIFSETGKYYCLQRSQNKIELYDISTGISHFIIEKNLQNCTNLQFHENDQVFSAIVNDKSIYIWYMNQII